MAEEVRKKKIAGQTNYIVGGHYFNDRAGAHHFASTGKALKGQHDRLGHSKSKALKKAKMWNALDNKFKQREGINKMSMSERHNRLKENHESRQTKGVTE